MPALSRYGAAGAQSKKLSRRLGKASEYGSLAQTAKETGVRTQQAIKDTLESIQKIAGAVGEVRKDVQYGKEVEDIASGAYGIETTTEKGFLGIPKTTYTEADTGKELSAMDIYAYGKYGEGTAKHERLFGEEAWEKSEERRIKRQELTPEQRETGMEKITKQREADISAGGEYYGKRKEVYTDLMKRGIIQPTVGPGTPFETVTDDSAYVTRGVKPDALEGGAVIEEPYVEVAGSQYSKAEMDKMKAGRAKSSLTPKVSQPTLDPSRKEPEETEKFEAVPMNVAEPSSTDVFRPPDEAMSQIKAPDRDFFPGGTTKEVVAATLLGEAGTQGRKGMGAVMSTIRSRQSTLASRGEKYSLAEIALAPSQYSFWNKSNVQMSSDVLGKIEQMKGENPRGWEAAMEMTENFQSDLPQAEFYLNPDIAEASEYNRFSSMEGQEYSIGEHIFKSAPEQVLSPAKLWESLWKKRGETGKKYQGIKWLMEE